MESLIGETIDNYKILSIIGRGGMGVVFKAKDVSLDKIVALKMIDPILARDKNFMDRFQTEARALAKLENPYIVNVFALRETDKGTFIVMEYVNPKNLTDWIKEKGAFSWEDSLNISIQLVTAIGYAHKVGVIHRDIKPSNILLTDDHKIKVTDFGLAKDIQAQDTAATMAQMRAGTLNYMSPEQVKGLKNVDKRSDLYSLGMTIYEMLTGRVPFDKADSEFTIQKKIVDGKVPSPIKFNTKIPKSFAKIILKATAADPLKRYQNADEMLTDLKNFKKKSDSKSSDTESPETVVGEPPKRNDSKKKLIIIAAGILMACILLFFIIQNVLRESESSSDVKDTLNIVMDTAQVINKNLEFGKIDLVSNPTGAYLTVNNSRKGKTPIILDSLESGNYKIKLSKIGYRNWQNDNLVVKAGEVNYLNINLIPIEVVKAKLTLKAVPSGSIFINNESVLNESAEVIVKSLNPGKHKIKFLHPNFGEKIATITLKSAETKNLTCYFRQYVNIQTLDESDESIWASIFLNNESTDFYTPKVLALSPSTYKIFVSKAGYETVEEAKTITVEPSFSQDPIPIIFHLKKL